MGGGRAAAADVVGRDEGREFASRNGFMFFEVSALTGANVSAMIWSLLSAMVDAVPGADDELKERTIHNALVMCLDAGTEPPVRLKVRLKRDFGRRDADGDASAALVPPLSELQPRDEAEANGRRSAGRQKPGAGAERRAGARSLSRLS